MKKLNNFLIILSIYCLAYTSLEAKPSQILSYSLEDSNSVTAFHLDSSSIERFIEKDRISSTTSDQIKEFYKGRNYQHAWVTEDGLSEQAQIFLNIHDHFQFYSGDSSLKNTIINSQIELLQTEGINMDSLQSYGKLEIQLTEFFIAFIKRAYSGKVDPKNLQWHIPQKKVKIVSLLNELTGSKDLAEGWLPVSKQYILMKQNLLRLKALQDQHWTEISFEGVPILKSGDTLEVIKSIKRRLMTLGDLIYQDTSLIFDNRFETVVKSFQNRHGLTADGIIGPKFIEAVNIPIQEKLTQMLINMERMRWMPEQQEPKRVVVNIPEFKLHVFEDGKDILNMDVVVGKAATRTVIFSDQIKHVVFSPYWNLPQSIVRNEVMPGLESDPDYIANHNMEIRGERNGLPIVRQRPGPGNALGRVKFIFPNKYSIYLHDTPSKYLFQRTNRAFSHGCIRLEDPTAFASNLLVEQKEWNSERINSAMSSGSELWVKLDNPVPVYITYFTSWIDSSGKLNFRKDIYGHDQKLAAHLFKP